MRTEVEDEAHEEAEACKWIWIKGGKCEKHQCVARPVTYHVQSSAKSRALVKIASCITVHSVQKLADSITNYKVNPVSIGVSKIGARK